MKSKRIRKAIDKMDQVPSLELKKLIEDKILEGDLYKSLFDQSRDGYIIIKEGKAYYYNEAFLRLIPSNRIIARKVERPSIFQLILDDDIIEFLTTPGCDSKSDGVEFYFQSGGNTKVVNIKAECLYIDSGTYLGVKCRDVSEEKQKETRLRRSESLASMTTMAAGIAHEIKNPLAAMKIHVQLLRKEYERKGQITYEQAERYLNVLEEEISYLNGIAVDFLFAVKPMNVDLKLADVNNLCKDIVNFIEPELNDNLIEIECKYAQYLPKVELDVNYMKQALLNIVKNAMHAMEGGGNLTILTKLDGDFISLSISDTGSGIPEEKISKIFEPYYTTKDTGTGLGLTVVFKVIKEHKGEISVSSVINEGTTFTILLPIPQSERIALEDHKEYL